MSQVEVTSVSGWAEACSSAFVPLRVRSASPRFSASLQQRVLSPEVSLTRVQSGASEVFRSDRLIAQHPRDDLLVSLHRSGTGAVLQHDREATLKAGSAALYDAASPYTLVFPGEMSEIVLQVPRRSIPVGTRALTNLTGRPLPGGGALRALMTLAECTMPGHSGDHELQEPAVADALVSLLTAVVAGSTQVAPALDSHVLALTVRGFIDQHLGDPLLHPESVARAHHVSLRLLQKIFAQSGDSPAAFIRRRRLEAARRLLVAGEHVGRAAALSGFNDADTFRRAFQRQFGVSPSSLNRSVGA
ncbi:helix-turn-helix domain-containing protein [Nocardioides mangrovicus]|uniref:Helix-turn-helix domain-containing protein n=1 Tax=Nocardioides mangrovicus TaxID=2478913 RepID=A0A3L8P1M1_9ACTN|nr:helix-turn-helix domain-containing protein [Nocardioides mangrovicus]RLV48499.1 helix-turn-helix domain-containing protein [Nocardioides mangrovicus]